MAGLLRPPPFQALSPPVARVRLRRAARVGFPAAAPPFLGRMGGQGGEAPGMGRREGEDRSPESPTSHPQLHRGKRGRAEGAQWGREAGTGAGQAGGGAGQWRRSEPIAVRRPSRPGPLGGRAGAACAVDGLLIKAALAGTWRPARLPQLPRGWRCSCCLRLRHTEPVPLEREGTVGTLGSGSELGRGR